MSTGSELYDLLAKTNATLNPNNTITLRFNDGSSYTTGVIKDGPELSPADKAMEEAKEASVISQAAMEEANKAAVAAGNAEQSASEAAASATNAENFASEAQQSASRAASSATNAETSAGNAATSASNAATNAQAAATSASAAEGSAQTAATSASEAKTQAGEAKTQATAATNYANGALTSLSTVQDVIGVLDWAQKNAQYSLTADTDIVPGKTYWTRSGSGTEADPYTYAPVVSPVKTQLSNYYEISGVDEAMADYINTHLALLDDGLYVLSDGSGWKVRIANDGVYIVDPQGNTATKYKDAVTLGNDDGSQSYQYLDYHSMQLIDKEGNPYFYVSDLRDANGEVEITDVFNTGEYAIFSMPAYSIISIVVDGEDVTETASVVVFGDKGSGRPDETPVPWDSIRIDGASNKETIIVYKTKSDVAKAFTFGSRRSGSNVGAGSVAIGQNVSATKRASHAEGEGTNANGICAHSEGSETTALYCSHSEGSHTYADAYGHAEGIGSIADGNASHAEGEGAEAHGQNSHSEGRNTKAIAPFAHAQNQGTVAASCSQTVIGDYNVIETITESFTGDGSTWLFTLGYSVFEIQSVLIDGVEQSSNSFTLSRNSIKFKTTPAIGAQIEVTYVSTTAPRGDYALIIGNGTDDNNRSNAATVDWQGNVKTAGSVTENNGTRDIDLNISEATIALYDALAGGTSWRE